MAILSLVSASTWLPLRDEIRELCDAYNQLYPHSKVIFDLIEPQNLAQQDVTALKKLLEKEANSLAKKGEVMVYEVSLLVSHLPAVYVKVTGCPREECKLRFRWSSLPGHGSTRTTSNRWM